VGRGRGGSRGCATRPLSAEGWASCNGPKANGWREQLGDMQGCGYSAPRTYLEASPFSCQLFLSRRSHLDFGQHMTSTLQLMARGFGYLSGTLELEAGWCCAEALERETVFSARPRMALVLRHSTARPSCADSRNRPRHTAPSSQTHFLFEGSQALLHPTKP